MLKDYPIISVSPEIMGGTPVFAGTRVPAQTLLDYLKAGESIVSASLGRSFMLGLSLRINSKSLGRDRTTKFPFLAPPE